MIPIHGFASIWFGRRTRSLGNGGNRGATAGFGVFDGLGGMMTDALPGEYGLSAKALRKTKGNEHSEDDTPFSSW